MRSQWIRDCEAFILVYSITQRSTFEILPKFIDQIINDKCESDNVLIIVGNKSDLEKFREVTKEEGMNFAKENSSKFLETSAKTRTNVDEVFFMAVREIMKKNPHKKSDRSFFSFCLLL